MNVKLPRILSPNLGCPVIVSPEDLRQAGVDVVIAEPIDAARSDYSIVAKPSYARDGQEFILRLGDGHELTDPGLPQAFDGVKETRFLISTTLRNSIFAGKARFVRFCAKPKYFPIELRTVSGVPRLTLYDLILKKGAEELFTVFHALALRPSDGTLRFIHATDLHVALHNDTYDVTLKVGEEGVCATSSVRFNNSNNNLRRFIHHVNDLADCGKLDFVLMLGDLVDFVKHNHSNKEDYGQNNWKIFIDIITGPETRAVGLKKNPGIKVPVFTSTGNHDWRFFPYPPKAAAAPYGLNKKSAKTLDPFWADDPEELVKKTKEAYQKMIGEGALLSNVMLGGKYLHKVGDWLRNMRDKFREPHPVTKVRGNLLDWSLPRMATWQVQLLAPLIISSSLAALNTALSFLVVVFTVVSGVMNGLIGGIKFLVRWKAPQIMALEAGWEALRDYFLKINPHFNYAFQIGRNYFLILDTGFDCLRAQRFWDDGRKKLGPLSIKDALLGGSPDSMGFYDANEFYPYNQIAWIEGLLRHITQAEGKKGSARIFVGVHTPPINLSKKQRFQADIQRKGRDSEEIRLEKGDYDIRYGSINHYLSQFLHLCLGCVEHETVKKRTAEKSAVKAPPEAEFRHITMTFAGHAHWSLECCLRWDTDQPQPSIYYGNFPGDYPGEPRTLNCLDPLILQTPAIGPKGDDLVSVNPPHFRWIEIDEEGAVSDARVTNPDLHVLTGVLSS